METPRLDHPDFAEFYDELPLWSAPFAQRILERAPLRRGSVIFDVGCGTGFLALELAQRCGPDARVHAVDPWPAAMARLDRKLAYHGVGNVELVVRDAADTGLPDGSADLIVSNLGINNFDDPAAVLAECRRILKRGGRLMLTTNLRGHMAEVYAALREVAAELGLDAAGVDAAEAQRGTVSSTAGRAANYRRRGGWPPPGSSMSLTRRRAIRCASPMGRRCWATGSCAWPSSRAGSQPWARRTPIACCQRWQRGWTPSRPRRGTWR